MIPRLLVGVVGLKPTSLAVPNRAFYQLNYTPIFIFAIISHRKTVAKIFAVCGQSCGLAGIVGRNYAMWNQRFRQCSKAFPACNNASWIAPSILPKQGCYQLRYTPIFDLCLSRCCFQAVFADWTGNLFAVCSIIYENGFFKSYSGARCESMERRGPCIGCAYLPWCIKKPG